MVRARLAGVGVVAASVLSAGLVAGCSSDGKVPSIGYAFDNVVTTYNANTAEGAASGAGVAFPRVLTGAFYTGPEGQQVADTDWGTAKETPGETLTIQYRLNKEGEWSDGVATSCDDMVLAWAARSGRYPQFEAADTAGYSDIDRVVCTAGSKDAIVVFRPGRKYLDWRTLFGATELLPAHVLTKAVNVSDLSEAVKTASPDTIASIAAFWNSGWKLEPGQLDSSRFPSSGPYRVDSYSKSDGLVLVANDKWWGRKPETGRIVLWPKIIDVKSKIAAKAVEVLDVGANSVDGLDLAGFDSVNRPSRGVEQLILSASGVFGTGSARKALALCVPRQEIYDRLGHPGYGPQHGFGSGVVNSRLIGPDSLIYPAVVAEGGKYLGGDAKAAAAALGSTANTPRQVRVGYLGPDVRRAKTVAAMTATCQGSGLDIVDAGATDFDPRMLGEGKVDVILAGAGGGNGATGTLDDVIARYALKAGSGINYGRFANSRYNALVDQLAVDRSVKVHLNATVEAETLLWNEMPSIPLFSQPRTIAFGQGMGNTIANPNKAGSGWNMDRWVLKR